MRTASLFRLREVLTHDGGKADKREQTGGRFRNRRIGTSGVGPLEMCNFLND